MSYTSFIVLILIVNTTVVLFLSLLFIIGINFIIIVIAFLYFRQDCMFKSMTITALILLLTTILLLLKLRQLRTEQLKVCISMVLVPVDLEDFMEQWVS